MATQSEKAVGGSHEKVHPSTRKIISLLANALNKKATFVSEEEYVESYKEIFVPLTFKEDVARPLAGSSVEAKKLRENFKLAVLKEVQQEIELFVEEEELNSKFTKLDELKGEFQSVTNYQKRAWRPPGDPKEHMKPFNLSLKVDEKNSLLCQVNAEREKLNILKGRVDVKRRRIVQTHSVLKEKMQRLTDDLNAASIREPKVVGPSSA